MKSGIIGMLLAVMILATLGAQAVMAGDPLPLKHGAYYPEDVKCPVPGEYVPDSVGGLLYDGKDCAFNTHHEGATIKSIKNTGNTYYITRQVEYNGGESKYLDHMTIKIKNRTSFILLHDAETQKITKQKETVYRWCGDENMQRF